MSSGGEPHVSLWVKSEVFSYGALPIAPHPRLTFNVSLLNYRQFTLRCRY